MDKILLLKVQVEGMDCLLCLNGILVSRLRPGAQVCLPVHEFIQPGSNRLQLVALTTSHGPAKTGMTLADCSYNITVEIQKDRGPSILVQGHLLYQAEGKFCLGDRLHQGLMLDASFDLPVMLPRWRFLDVLQAEGTCNDLPRLEAFLLRFIRLLQAGKVADLIPLFLTRNQELVAAYQMDEQQVQSDFRTHWQEIVARGVLCNTVLSPDNWLFHPSGHSAVYSVLNREFDPLVRFHFEKAGQQLIIPLHLGVLGNDVFVLR